MKTRTIYSFSLSPGLVKRVIDYANGDAALPENLDLDSLGLTQTDYSNVRALFNAPSPPAFGASRADKLRWVDTIVAVNGKALPILNRLSRSNQRSVRPKLSSNSKVSLSRVVENLLTVALENVSAASRGIVEGAPANAGKNKNKLSNPQTRRRTAA